MVGGKARWPEGVVLPGPLTFDLASSSDLRVRVSLRMPSGS